MSATVTVAVSRAAFAKRERRRSPSSIPNLS
jgi:hypothetical protein